MEFKNKEDTNKESFTKDEIAFADNLALALINGTIFDNVHGKLLIIPGIDNDKRIIFHNKIMNLTNKQFNDVRDKYNKLTIKAYEVKQEYNELSKTLQDILIY